MKLRVITAGLRKVKFLTRTFNNLQTEIITSEALHYDSKFLQLGTCKLSTNNNNKLCTYGSAISATEQPVASN